MELAGIERQVPHDLTCMWNLKKSITKKLRRVEGRGECEKMDNQDKITVR
jgi:hypothetical protein